MNTRIIFAAVLVLFPQSTFAKALEQGLAKTAVAPSLRWALSMRTVVLSGPAQGQ